MHPDTFPANPNQANPNQVRQLDDSVGVQGIPTPDSGIAAEADLAAAADIDARLEETTAENEPQEGKLVFKPNELNQSGEDKEYFHPKDDHKFNAPKDANEHALTPDIEVTPDNTIKTIR